MNEGTWGDPDARLVIDHIGRILIFRNLIAPPADPGPFAWRAIVPLVNWSFLASTVVFPFNLTAILLPSSMISYEFHLPAV